MRDPEAPMTLRVDEDRGRLLDARGRELRLRGVNLGARAKRPPHLPFELPPGAPLALARQRAERLIGRIASWGLNALRLPFSWAGLEPTPGAFSQLYLERLGAVLDAAHGHRLRVILDLHQDLFAAPLGGDGLPAWALPEALRGQAAPAGRHWFMGYAPGSPAQRAFDALWRNEAGRLEALEAMWRRLLEALGEHPAVVGVELMNEPGWGDTSLEAFERDHWLPLYERVGAWVRDHHPRLLLFYGGPGIETLEPWRRARFPHTHPCVFAPHLYDPGLLVAPAGGPTTSPTPALDGLARLAREAGVPVLIGEVGVTHGARGARGWIEQLVAGLDWHGLSATLWECSASTWRWNGEDLNVLGPQGAPRPQVLTPWTQPWLCAIAGHRAQLRRPGPDPDHLVARWVAAAGVTELATPARLGPPPAEAVELIGEQARWWWDADRHRLCVQAAPGETVELEVHRFSRAP